MQLPFPNSEGNSSVFETEHDGLEMKFAEEFARLQGKFIFCTSKNELLDNLLALWLLPVNGKMCDCRAALSLMKTFQLHRDSLLSTKADKNRRGQLLLQICEAIEMVANLPAA